MRKPEMALSEVQVNPEFFDSAGGPAEGDIASDRGIAKPFHAEIFGVGEGCVLGSAE